MVKYGSSVSTSTNAMRLGYTITMSPSTVTASTSSVTLTLRLYFQTRYPVYDSSNSWAISGNWSGSGSASISHGSSSSWSNSNRTLIATRSITVSPSYSGTISRSFSASMSGINAIPGTARVSGSFTVPRRPVSAPAAPTGVTVTRNSDGSQSLHWSNTSPTSASRPYSTIQIQRWDTVRGGYTTIANVSTRTSYTDRTTAANNRYRYAIRARNAGGYSSFAYSPYIATTPAAPSNVRATKNTAGDITISWSLSGINYHTGVEVWATAGGVDQTSRLTLRGSGVTSWTHTNPDPSKTWQYRVRAVSGSLSSAYSARSNLIQLLTNPLPPTGLSPSGVAMDGRQPITLRWQHNEVDGTDQTRFQIAHRLDIDGESWTYEPEIQSSVSEWELPADTYENGAVVVWRVRTWGLYSGSSPYSASGRITLSTPPIATITDPEPDSIVGWSATGVHWEYYDEENDRQTQWRAHLLDANSETLETRSGAGETTSTTFGTVLQDGTSYRISVEVRDATGLWSEPDIIDISVHYPAPPRPAVEATWHHETGAVTIAIDNPPPVEGETIDAIHNNIWRSIDGDDWVLIAQNVPLETAITDYIPALNTINYYRAVAVSELPSQAESPPVAVSTEDTRWWVWINAGPGFVQGVRVRDNAEINIDAGREKELVRFAGRRHPVEFTGEQRTTTIGLSARLAPESSTRAEILALADLPAPACIRALDGTRYFVSTGSPTVSTRGTISELSWDFTEIDHIEQTQPGGWEPEA